MLDEDKTKKEELYSRDLISPSFLPVFFLAIFLINAFWIAAVFEKRIAFIFGAVSLLTSVLLAFFLFYRLRRIRKSIKIIEGDYTARVQEKEQAVKNCVYHENELEKMNAELKKTNLEFSKTTRQLFEREQELNRANKRLKELDRVKSEFVSVAAHQLRTPLTGVKWSYVTILEDDTGSLSKESRKIAEKGLETINYAIDIINDLLNTSRLEDKKFDLSLSVQPIGPIIERIVNQNKALVSEKKINLNIDLPLEAHPAFKFDQEKISIVFDNILANAIKYTPEGGRIDIKSFRKENEIEFKISDTGIGIPEEDLDRVFTKFFRSKNAVSFQTSGSGLGLYIAKSIIESHGGTITLESEENKGTTVIFTLPIDGKKNSSA